MRKNNKVQRSPPPPKNISNKNNTNNTSIGASLLGNILTGFSFGTGSAIGHRVVGSIFDSGNKIQDNTKPEINLNYYTPSFDKEKKCIELKNDLEKCYSQSSNCDKILDEFTKLQCSF